MCSQRGYIYVLWNQNLGPYRACTCKICYEFWDQQEWEHITDPAAALKRWNYYAKKKRTWQDQARDFYKACHENYVKKKQESSSEEKINEEEEKVEDDDKTKSYPKGVDFGDMKVCWLFL